MAQSNYDAKTYVIVGGTGTGKSTFARKIINEEIKKGKKPYIFDVNNEYSDLPRSINFDEFLDELIKKENTIAVIEEATVFVSNKQWDKRILEILVKKRHSNNSIVFLYHSLRAVPVNIADLANYFCIKKTNDNPQIIATKFKGYDEITQALENSKESKNQYITSIVELNK